MRIGLYADQGYVSADGAIYASQPFVLFMLSMRQVGEQVILLGRLDPRPASSHYRLPADVEFAPLPWYEQASDPLAVVRTAWRSLRAFWHALDTIDLVLVFGPGPMATAFAIVAKLRGKPVALGVRQDYPAYVRLRHPGRRGLSLAARALDAAFRLIARRCPVLGVGPELARRYGRPGHALAISISLVREADIVPAQRALSRAYAGELSVLTVSRLDREKNPLMLADVLARLRAHDLPVRLVVYGDGPLAGQLEERLRELGVADHAELRGHVSLADGLLDAYFSSHVFLHVSWTEGMPQVLLEAFARGIPVVATAVGGVAQLATDAALLVGPGDPDAAAEAVRAVLADPDLRARLIEAGLERVRDRTAEAECRRIARFLHEQVALT